jgi:uncharacterized membrane protein YdbT with pleckstrin-like domain
MCFGSPRCGRDDIAGSRGPNGGTLTYGQITAQSAEVHNIIMIKKREHRAMIQIDMTADGKFQNGTTIPQSGFGNKVLRVALAIAGLAIIGAMAAFAFWLLLILIPIAIGAGVIAYAILRYRIWQAKKRGYF